MGLASPYSIGTRIKRWLIRKRKHYVIHRTTQFLDRHPHLAPALFFIGGVLWDVFTLQRIDNWVDNLFLLTYLVILGATIFVSTLIVYDQVTSPFWVRYKRWYPAVNQFLFGALFSAYVVFYAQSTAARETALFLGVLIVLLVGNEFIRNRLTNLYILLSLYFLVLFSFLVFFIPVVFKVVNYATFLSSGLIALGLLLAFVLYLYSRRCLETTNQYLVAAVVPVVLFGLLHVFYSTNLIPPVPLALREGGIYHHVSKEQGNDRYFLRYEAAPWYHLRNQTAPTFHYAPGDTVFCFTAIFAPTGVQKGVYHRWLYYDPTREAWTETDRIAFQQPIVGARDMGYRGYTFKQNIELGQWRVEVMTADHRLLGRIRFHIADGTHRRYALKSDYY